MKIGIITDSTTSVTEKIKNCSFIKIIELFVEIDGKSYESSEVSLKTFFDQAEREKKIPKTSQPTTQQFIDAYESMLKKYDVILGLFISQKLSGTFQNATLAKSMINENEQNKIKLFESASTAMTMSQTLDAMIDAVNNEMPLVEIETMIVDMQKKNKLIAVPDKLEYMAYSGRVPLTAAKVGGLLKIKLAIIMENGERPLPKLIARSDKGILKKIKNILAENDVKEVYITNGLMAQELYDKYMETFKSMHIKIVDAVPNAVPIAHFGRGCIGISFQKN